MPWNEIPFDPLVDFAALADQDVLEIGVGNGSHAQLLSSRADSYTGIDLTDNAVNATTQRLNCFGIDANISRMDAERLEFPDNSFDLVWSWGVIHHSADTRRILSEIARVLRPGGRCITMVYHRSFWFYYIYRGLIPGLFKFKFFRGMSLTQVVESGTDGAIARFYTIPDWKKLVSEFMDVERVEIYGQQDELLPLPGGEFKERICDAIPTSIAKSFLTRFKQGSFLVSIQRKRG
jgi:SAM-dependent methyltransferase